MSQACATRAADSGIMSRPVRRRDGTQQTHKSGGSHGKSPEAKKKEKEETKAGQEQAERQRRGELQLVIRGRQSGQARVRDPRQEAVSTAPAPTAGTAAQAGPTAGTAI